jgi:hypothetical protein
MEVLVFFVLVPTNTKLTHEFGSKVLVLILVCYKLTLTPHPNITKEYKNSKAKLKYAYYYQFTPAVSVTSGHES